VHAFEPLAACCKAAQANATVNGVVDRVNLNQLALGSEATSEHLSLTFGGRQGTLCADILNDVRTGATQVVSVVRLDDYCESVGVDRVDVLKLDVEGYEINVLEGAPQTLAHTRVVVMEWHSPDRAQRADRLLVQAGLTFEAHFSDALHGAGGIGYWVRQ
jgi:FkbM family methyltransferase